MKMNCGVCNGKGKIRSWLFWKKDCENCSGKGFTNIEDNYFEHETIQKNNLVYGDQAGRDIVKEETMKEKCPWCFMLVAGGLISHKKVCNKRPGQEPIHVYESKHEEPIHSHHDDVSSLNVSSSSFGSDSGSFGGGDFGGGGASGDV